MDWNSKILPWGVRIQWLFGLDFHDITLGCPNPAVIRTGILRYYLGMSESSGYLDWNSKIYLGVSESSGYSDWNSKILPWGVQIQQLFGLEFHDITLGCPNPVAIWTGIP
ncbi:hypothetical protein DOE78_04725 [Bacillus sp. Y1]|nr:hypothetical protein DOE78_04725 [Bacillus sp. Y1]